jgi:hypothetical protein
MGLTFTLYTNALSSAMTHEGTPADPEQSNVSFFPRGDLI